MALFERLSQPKVVETQSFDRVRRYKQSRQQRAINLLNLSMKTMARIKTSKDKLAKLAQQEPDDVESTRRKSRNLVKSINEAYQSRCRSFQTQESGGFDSHTNKLLNFKQTHV